jgi:hypothetical protein
MVQGGSLVRLTRPAKWVTAVLPIQFRNADEPSPTPRALLNPAISRRLPAR